ncbi:undecaprenyldiphospho-muramoylpentapeptide beta-N-acetylglucosaminyltransferase [Psychroflexus sp. YR1-1]|uniref:UDP-N-acetylglucosamine--N-acetylmuramyl-(pentapeptide) pyrophosphoryl-undecaprenol N-acetylglucosamine transferase n=1 Tax=Psychroflexus aurantiacus TaxID=2709310 RepID=A0A6B3QZH7_9FLAO|nr:undecaprenyldiphospho-muramoylpentapeptide beta-N-acetylglucosaminyltransferase [Psychroflexus aurantiacus]NEV93753.1 undecaprenyldiphospho-muramoylpentapeptide beta-N-acetylglucosaminyltransferase [Psychroflexus aurantiacus]
MSERRYMISGGGTGGHIYPAIAIAEELKGRHPEAEFLFVGAKDKMEMTKVPEAGFEIEGLWISGIQRKLSLSNLMFPFKLMSSMLKARTLLKRFKPNVVVGTGGYASGPLLKMASILKIPTLIQEQNAYAGITNKWLAEEAQSICVAYEGMEQFFPKEKVVFTGNPIRKDLLEVRSKREAGLKHFQLDSNKKTVLIVGGSLGSQRINELIAGQLSWFEAENLQVLWQCGKLYYDRYAALETESVKVLKFISNMDLAYAVADVIISRAGAGAVSELSLVGKPVLFIPSPNVAEDHQTKNAKSIEDKEAAVMLREKDLDDKFEPVFKNLIQDIELQKKLSKNILTLAKPLATKAIADEVERLENAVR